MGIRCDGGNVIATKAPEVSDCESLQSLVSNSAVTFGPTGNTFDIPARSTISKVANLDDNNLVCKIQTPTDGAETLYKLDTTLDINADRVLTEISLDKHLQISKSMTIRNLDSSDKIWDGSANVVYTIELTDDKKQNVKAYIRCDGGTVIATKAPVVSDCESLQSLVSN